MRSIAASTLLLSLLGCSAAPTPEAAPKASADDPRVEVAASITFTEGPTVYKDGSVFFSEMRSNRTMRYFPEDGHYETFRADAHGANGLLFDSEWRLISCETTPPRITRTNVETGEVEVLADSYEGKRLHQPNDVTFDAKGRLYFSDRPGETIEPDQTGVFAVYRIDPDGTIDRILSSPDIQMPNGVIISPDDKILYLIEAHPDADHARMIRAYDLAEDGTVSNMRVFHDFYPGRSGDGMTIDAEGNLWVCAGLLRTRGTSETLDTQAGVHVFAPSGERIDFYPVWEDTITNAAFGGPDLKTLYVTAGKTLFQIQSPRPGTRR
ncbi:MAG: SMP-30/gluconolactonase/LRE family protein [Acidobacteria bacterium]|nr:SMP-30/gluconolactonase/LRE family protein [Acidobacteriota bacterium]